MQNFAGRQANPLAKNEQFAVSLRKAKKAKLLEARRKKLFGDRSCCDFNLLPNEDQNTPEKVFAYMQHLLPQTLKHEADWQPKVKFWLHRLC